MTEVTITRNYLNDLIKMVDSIDLPTAKEKVDVITRLLEQELISIPAQALYFVETGEVSERPSDEIDLIYSLCSENAFDTVKDLEAGGFITSAEEAIHYMETGKLMNEELS